MEEDLIPMECPTIARRLSAWEIQEARKVFDNGLDYERVRVHECVRWPDTLDRLGRKLRRLPPPVERNAITIRNDCYFPVRLLQGSVPIWHPEHYKIAWLIHELTHSWQYQKLGVGYLFRAIKIQFRSALNAYDFGGENGLLEGAKIGKSLRDFNLEQQGEICRSFYNRLVRGDDVQAWLPFIAEIQHG